MPNVGGKRRDSLASIQMMMQEKMGRKRQLEIDMYQALTGASRTLQMTHFTKEFILATHTMDVGGLEGACSSSTRSRTPSTRT